MNLTRFRLTHGIATLLAAFSWAFSGAALALPPGSFVEVAAGLGLHACGRLETGGVQCWGANGSGQLGNNSLVNSAIPVNVVGITTAVQITAGDNHSCARLADNTLRCWGGNANGQLGNNSTTSSPVPVPVNLITGATQVSAGDAYTCARLIAGGGSVRCWGSNTSGQLGDSSNTQRLEAVATVGGTGTTGATSLSAGTSHTCARISDGTLRCWGLGTIGQLGDGLQTTSNVPVTVSTISSATSVSAGFAHTCARLADGTLRCWGSNVLGRLGDGTSTTRLVPTTVVGIAAGTATGVDAGSNQTCAIMTDNTLRCWGAGDRGQIGNGAFVASTTPLAVLGINTAIALSSGSEFSCAVLSSGAVKCWGHSTSGKLGNGDTVNNRATPGAVLPSVCTMDVDGDGVVLGTTDAVLLARAAMGLGGASVTQNATGAGALRAEWADVRGYLTALCGMTGLAP